ncbi:MAG TPA: ABC transporter ATP-binding protein [Thermoplasmata archaeon]|nr:ABC transporter ATP-binding protein [Thermoplasmata archaeon]
MSPLATEEHPRTEVVLSGVERVFHAGTPEEVRALRGIRLRIEPGTFLSIEGPSGGGKTTLLNILGLLDRPTVGTVKWNGGDVAALSERERAHRRLDGVGFIFQRFFLVPTLTARENVELPLRAAGRPAAERRARADDLLGQVGVAARAKAYPHQLSGGEEQRVAIARALANRPGLVLADEPTGELDRANTEIVVDLLSEIHQRTGATVVLVTHNPIVAQRARRHLTLQDGSVVRDSAAE